MNSIFNCRNVISYQFYLLTFLMIKARYDSFWKLCGENEHWYPMQLENNGSPTSFYMFLFLLSFRCSKLDYKVFYGVFLVFRNFFLLSDCFVKRKWKIIQLWRIVDNSWMGTHSSSLHLKTTVSTLVFYINTFVPFSKAKSVTLTNCN